MFSWIYVNLVAKPLWSTRRRKLVKCSIKKVAWLWSPPNWILRKSHKWIRDTSVQIKRHNFESLAPARDERKEKSDGNKSNQKDIRYESTKKWVKCLPPPCSPAFETRRGETFTWSRKKSENNTKSFILSSSGIIHTYESRLYLPNKSPLNIPPAYVDWNNRGKQRKEWNLLPFSVPSSMSLCFGMPGERCGADDDGIRASIDFLFNCARTGANINT